MGHISCEDIPNKSLETEYFVNSKLGHTTLLSTFFILAFCVRVQVNRSSQWAGFEQ